MLLLRTVLFTIIAPLSVAIVLPYFLVMRYPIWRVDLGAFHLAGLILLLPAWAIYVWCALEFYCARGTPAPTDPPKELVVRGLYRYTRNPMYVGVLTGILSMAILFGSGLLLLYTLAVFAAFSLFVTQYEEPHLRAVFGAQYEDYCRRVPRWLPRTVRSTSIPQE